MRALTLIEFAAEAGVPPDLVDRLVTVRAIEDAPRTKGATDS
jgi:hypothetical protein